MSSAAPIGTDRYLVRRTPCLVAAALSTATVALLLPLWVVAAIVIGTIGLMLLTRSDSTATVARATSAVSFALGCAVGPVVFLLLAGIVEIS